MNRLWLQLTFGFALVALVSIVTVAALANARARDTFRGYLAQSQALESGLVERLAEHYATYGSWEGVEALLARGPGAAQRPGRGVGGPPWSVVVLTDSEGRVVVGGGGLAAGQALSAWQLAQAIPIVVNGQVAGYLVARASGAAALPPAAQRFLDSLNGAFWTAGALAGGAGLVLGLLIAWRLAAPLRRLATGARRIAAGQFDERVPVAGPAEVRTVATAFNDMAAALAAGEAERRHMVADIAHELRTPLTVIQGNLRAMLDEVYPLTRDEVARIYEASLGLSRLVDDLRTLSLAEAGRLDLHVQPVAVGPLLAREAALFADLAAGQGVHLHVETPGDLPEALADPERLAQVLHNLLSNALRYTPAGGHITLRAAAGANGSVRLEVEDTGAGIAPEDLPHVFERFYRADRGRAREHGGSGLGLTIAHELVRLQGGRMGVESAPGRGARFWFTLPVCHGRSGPGVSAVPSGL
ncbi:MAG: HAMP domain-containing histidine kinase [Chloroflexaceae bacterium]|nr:HAMP domain-containing histidine kinase [Chloroflexaceae bacterium]